ncbi:transcriptional regulator [Agromyces protaetiae]|uniref:histidine kinase n=1 Tax=Agromyces protaetiae TaxID=2509455 RepID=A0A4P6FE17_9MICO|nr:ATP-binding protein [Agromyces protaetiae]QAY73243.1 transcriptional regulator [Agromyces protaetiae]
MTDSAIATPGRTGRIARRAIILAVLVAISLTMEISGFIATPAAEREEVSYTTIHAIVPIVFAVCAAVAWAIGPTPLPARLMAAIVVLWIPQPIYAVIGDIGWLWPIVRGIDLWWAVAAGILVLVYPRGWLADRADRIFVRIAYVATFVNLVAVLLLAGPGENTCDCVANPYRIADLPWLFDLIDNLYRFVGVTLLLIFAVRLLVRWVRGSVPARAVAFTMPVAILAWALAAAAETLSYAADTTSDLVIRTVSLLGIASIPVSFVAGISHTRALRARVADLMKITREGADRAVWAASLAETLRDDSVSVYWWDDERGRYYDAAGEPVDAGHADPRGSHSMLPVTAPSGAPIALIRHDRVLTDNMRLLDGVSSALRLSVDNGRLRSEVERTLEHVRQSRQRILEAGIEARRRIERNLHDGAQQRFVALGMHLRLAADRAAALGDADLAAELEGAIVQLSAGLKELRELAHGIHPSLLSQGGLALAVPELAGRCPVPVEVDVQAEGRLPEIVESTSYFVIAELLANIAKHSGATRAWVRAHVDDGRFEFSVRDNGSGGVSLEGGSGMVGLVDRVDAVDGTIELESPPGAGTTVVVRVPITASEREQQHV